jgi:hypothetical protein
MVLTDRNRLMVSIVLGSIVYIISILLILLFMEISAGREKEFEDLVFVELARDIQVVDVNRKQEKVSENRQDNSNNSTERSDSSTRDDAGVSRSEPAASSGNMTAAAGGSTTQDPGTRTTDTGSTSFSSRGTPSTFSSSTTTDSDVSLPDFPDSDSRDDFFTDENVSSYEGTADPSRNSNTNRETRGDSVVEIRDADAGSFSSRSASGSTATEGLGTATESGSTFSSTSTSRSGSSSVQSDEVSGSADGATVSESTGTRSRNLSGTDSRSGSSGDRNTNDNNSGSDGSSAQRYGIDVDGDARFRKIVSGPNKIDLEEALRLYREYLPPSIIIEISFTVTPQGSITDLKLLTSLGYSKVEATVLNWMRGFRFSGVSTNDFISGVISIKLDLE